MIINEKPWCHGWSWMKDHDAMDDQAWKAMMPWMTTNEKPWCHGWSWCHGWPWMKTHDAMDEKPWCHGWSWMKSHDAMDDHEWKTMMSWMTMNERPWYHGWSWMKSHDAMDDHEWKTMMPCMIMNEKPWCHYNRGWNFMKPDEEPGSKWVIMSGSVNGSSFPNSHCFQSIWQVSSGKLPEKHFIQTTYSIFQSTKLLFSISFHFIQTMELCKVLKL